MKMIYNLYIFLFFVLSNLNYCYGSQRVISPLFIQIKSDLSDLTKPVFSREELCKVFDKYNRENRVGLIYCKIRRNRLSVFETNRNSEFRKGICVNFLNRLARKHKIPDTDFIICLEDGFHENADAPIFTFGCNSKTKKNILLLPDCDTLGDPISFMGGTDRCINKTSSYSLDFPWERKETKGFFIGSSTGIYDETQFCFGNDRMKLLYFSYLYPKLLDASFSFAYQSGILNMLPSINKPIVATVEVKDQFRYKYLFDADGNSTSYSRTKWILLSNSVLVKVSSSLKQWYYNSLVPYENYVPVGENLEDLLEIFDWLRNHDEEACHIAKNGAELGLSIFSDEAVEQYVATLLTEYAKKISINQ